MLPVKRLVPDLSRPENVKEHVCCVCGQLGWPKNPIIAVRITDHYDPVRATILPMHRFEATLWKKDPYAFALDHCLFQRLLDALGLYFKAILLNKKGDEQFILKRR